MYKKKAHLSVGSNIIITSRDEIPENIYSDNEIDNPEYIKAINFGKKAWGVDPKIVLHTREAYNGIITTTLPRGYLSEVIKILKDKGFSLSYDNKMAKGSPSSTKLSDQYLEDRPLRPYQKDSFDCSEKLKRGVIVLPTGGGKTRVAQEIIHKSGVRTMILMHNDMLSQQWVEGIESAFNTKVGIFKDKKTPYHTADICISTFQSISATIKRHPDAFFKYAKTFGLIIIDEAHHVPASDFLNVTRYWTAQRMIALTASKKRSDGSEMILYRSIGPIIKEVVYLPPEFVLPAHIIEMESDTDMMSDYEAVKIRTEILDKEWTSKDESRLRRFKRGIEIKWEKEDIQSKKDFEFKIKKLEPDLKVSKARLMAKDMMSSYLDRVKTDREQYKEKEIKKEESIIKKEDIKRRKKEVVVNPWDIFQMSIIRDEKRSKSIVNMALKSDVKTMIVTDRIGHAESIASLFPSNHKTLVLHGNLSKPEMKKRRAMMGDVDTIVTTYSSFGEGIDVPTLGLAIMASPSKSIIRIPQTIGRVLRPDGKKKFGFAVDIVDSQTRIGINSYKERSKIYAENKILRKWTTKYNGNIADVPSLSEQIENIDNEVTPEEKEDTQLSI